MTFGELLRDFLRVAAVPAGDRWVVQVLNARLLRYVRGILDRHQLPWAWEPGAVMELHPDALAGLPGTAVKAIGTAALPGIVTATCRVVVPLDDDPTLFAHQVDAHERERPTTSSAAATASAPTAVAASTRDGARREILDAARAVLARTGREEFSMAEVLVEMRRRGTGYADSTIRTMIASHLCADATGPRCRRLQRLGAHRARHLQAQRSQAARWSAWLVTEDSSDSRLDGDVSPIATVGR